MKNVIQNSSFHGLLKLLVIVVTIGMHFVWNEATYDLCIINN